MISNWLFKVGSSIPRGYSRRYVLGLLRQHSMLTTKEIIDKAIENSEGRWRPSPGLIYHIGKGFFFSKFAIKAKFWAAFFAVEV
jgi:hypothetical protein